MQFGLKGTLLASTGLWAAAMLSVLAPAPRAIAQTVSIVHSGGGSGGTFPSITTALAAMTEGDTLNISPGPTAHCVGTIAVGATSCTLDSAAFSNGQGILIANASPTVPFRADITAVSGSIISWNIATYQQAVGPLVTFDYDEKGLFVNWGGTLHCTGAAMSCHIIPTTPPGQYIIAIGAAGEWPDTVVLDGLDIEGSGGYTKQTVCGVPLGFPAQVTACPGQMLPQLTGVQVQGAAHFTLENSSLEWNGTNLIGNEWVQGAGQALILNDLIRFNGDTGGQDHDIYIGRLNSATIQNSTLDSVWNGNDFKCRAITCVITGNHLGSDSQVLQNGSTVLDLSSNNAQFPDPGNVTFTNNIVIHGAGATNATPIAFSGTVNPWPNASFFGSGNTVTNSSATWSDFLWNNQDNGDIATSGTCRVDFRNNTLINTTSVSNPIIAGRGCQSVNTLNGTIQSTTTNTVSYIGSPNAPVTTCDFTTGSEPCSFATSPYTMTGSLSFFLALGDTHNIVVTPSKVGNYIFNDFISGPGGVDYTGSVQITFLDHTTDSPSTIVATNGGFSAIYWLNAPGDMLDLSQGATAGGGGVNVGSSNALVKSCTSSGNANCGKIEFKSQSTIHGAGGTIVENDNEPSVFMQSGGTVVLTGTGGGVIQGYCANPATDPGACQEPFSVFIFGPNYFFGNTNSTIALPNTSGTLLAQAFQLTSSGFQSYAVPGVSNYWYSPNNVPSPGIINDTVYLGTGNGESFVSGPFKPNIAGDNNVVIPGSGAGTISFSGLPSNTGEVEVVKGYGGGTITVIFPATTSLYPVIGVGYSGNPFVSTITGGGYTTLVTSDTPPTSVILKTTGSITQTTTITDTQTLTVPASQTIPANTTAQLAGISQHDPNAAVGTYNGMMLLREYVTGGSLIPAGNWASYATVTANGQALSMLAPSTVIDAFFTAQKYAMGAAPAVLTVDLSDQFGYESVSTENLTIGTSTSADLTLSGPSSVVVISGVPAAVPITLSDPWAAGQAGTLTALITDGSGAPIIVTGSTSVNGTLSLGASLTALQSLLSSMSFVSNGSPDNIQVTATNQGGYSQTLISQMVFDPSIDIAFNAPGSAIASATTPLAFTGSLMLGVIDGWSSGNATNIQANLNTDFGTIFVSGTPYAAPAAATIVGQVAAVNSILATASLVAPLSGISNVTLTARNIGNGTGTDTFQTTINALGSSTDLTIIYPPSLTLAAGGTLAIPNASLVSPYSSTTPGPVTMKIHGTLDTLVVNGSVIAPGSTATLASNISGLNSILSGQFAVVATGSTGCDYIILDVLNQAEVDTQQTITVTDTVVAFTISGPSSETVATSGSLTISPFSISEGTIAPTITANISDTYGMLTVGGQAVAPGVTRQLIGTQAQINAIIQSIGYAAPAIAATDTLVITATDSTGTSASPHNTSIIVTTGTSGTCPLP